MRHLPLALLAALVLPITAQAAPPDAAREALRARCAEDGRDLPEKPRLPLAVGEGRAASVEALAQTLGGSVRRVDTAAALTDPSGEAEKSLSALLASASRENTVLFFDDADALFGPATPASTALAERLVRLAGARVVILGLTTRPLQGRLGKLALSALPAAATPPWPGVCGRRL